MANLIGRISLHSLKKVVEIREKLESLRGELESMLSERATLAGRMGQRGRMTTAGRARVGEAVRARWAKLKSGSTLKGRVERKRKLSAAVRSRMAESAKARWAKVKAAGKTGL
jgi:hypothetical protein